MPQNWTEPYRKKHYGNNSEESGSKEFDLFYDLSHHQQSVDVECAWSKIHQKITQKASTGYGYFLRIAAMLVVTLGIIFTVYQYLQTGETGHLTEITNEDSSVKSYLLPDGSMVTLASHAKIRFVEDQSFTDDRQISLSGKAYFEIEKSTHPFTITTPEGRVKVLGTSFNLDTENGLDLYVTSGVVEVTTKSDRKIIQKGQRAIAQEGIIQVDSADDHTNIASWKTGHFRFDDTRLRELIPYLEAYYDISIATNRSIKNCRVTAEFDQESLEEVLSVITTILNAEVNQEGKKIRISGTGCN